MAEREAGPVKSVDTVLDVLETLREADGARVTELADRLDLSKSTVHDHLSTLRNRGYVVKDGDAYDVDVRWLRFGGYARKNLPVYSHAQTHVWELAQNTGELALLAIRQETSSVPVYQARGSKAVTTDSYAGIELPLHCTAAGKAMLASMSEPRVASILSEVELRSFTPDTITDRAALRTELDEIAEIGFALDDEERIEGMRGVSSAITREETGEVMGALAVTGPSHRLDDSQFTETLPDMVASRAREVEINVRYEEPS